MAAGPLGAAVLLLGAAAFVLLAIAEFLPVLTIELEPAGSCEIVAQAELRELCNPTGGERHTYALVVLGLLGLVMAWGAGIGESRPAAGALAVIGMAALGIVLVGDAPQVNDTGLLGLQYSDAKASPASGFWFSLAGGATALVAGVLGLLRGPRR